MYDIIDIGNEFSINRDNGMIYTSASMDREVTDMFDMNISVSDGTHQLYATLEVTVLDLNDNKPAFDKDIYEKTLSEGTAAGRNVITVKASDNDQGENGLITHWITGTYGKFQIDPVTGVVTTTSGLSVVQQPTYEMTVYARDHGENSFVTSTILRVHVNNTNFHAPEFSEFAYDVTLSESTLLDAPILKLQVSDDDELEAGNFDLHITKGNENEVFHINSNHELILQSKLDYEREQFHTLTVTATDHATDSRSSSIHILVTVTDVNDMSPVFLPMPAVVNIAGPVASGQLLFQFSAIDQDSFEDGNNAIQYRLLSHNDVFDLNSYIGELRAKTVPLGDYSINVQAFDQGSPSLSANVSLLVRVLNKNTMDLYPMFEQPVYRVTFNESKRNVPLHLVNMNAKIGDGAADDRVYYNMTGGPQGNKFTINHDNVRHIYKYISDSCLISL